jgi:hypothetical protein
VAARELVDARRQGGREEDGLALGRRPGEDLLEVSAKPMSSISSASSSTTVCTARGPSVPRPRWSTGAAGVATTTSTPRSSALSWRPIGWPP